MPVFALPDEHIFPDPRLAREDGLLAVGGDLHPRRLLLGYTMGIFPWYNEGQPILWHSPDPRFVLLPEQLGAVGDGLELGGYGLAFVAHPTEDYRSLHAAATLPSVALVSR